MTYIAEFCGRNSTFFDTTLLNFLSPPKILSHLVQLMLFYIFLRGIRELCFEDLDLAREERFFDLQEQYDMPDYYTPKRKRSNKNVNKLPDAYY